MRARRRHGPGAWCLLGLLALAACGGGGGSGGQPAPDLPPLSLAYPQADAVLRTERPITPLIPTWTGGDPTSWSVEPPLPEGLVLGSTTGHVSGTPRFPTPAADHVVRAQNAAGAVETTLRIEVRPPAAASLVPAEDLAEEDLRYFLRRTHWGIRPRNLDALRQLGLPAYVDAMLTFPEVGTTEHERQAAQLLLRDTDPPGQEGMFPTRRQLGQWWLTLMLTNPNTFQEVLAFFWHDHFATSSEVLDAGSLHWMRAHVDLLRGRGAGNLRGLLLAMARDWAMLRWLDGIASTARAPNENFAREWFELFALGVDAGYEQEDIVEASRAFTGYRQVTLDADTGLRGVLFDPARHDSTDKTLFGVTIPGQGETDDYAAVVDITIQERDVAGWIAGSLLRGFCRSDPPPALVEAYAQTLRDAGFELAPALRTLFLSEAFFSPEARAGFVKSPVEAAIGFIHATSLSITAADLERRLDSQGQVPTRPPTVNGWPGGPQWLSAQGMVDRANLVRACIGARTLQEELGVQVADLLPSPTATSSEVVDAVALRLGVSPDSEERDAYIRYLDTQRLAGGSVVDDPFVPTNPTHLDDRLRGLLYVLAQHPTYMLR